MNTHSAFRLIPLLVIAIALVSCSDDDNAIIVEPPVTEPVLRFLQDTYYATPEDSVRLEAVIAGEPAAMQRIMAFGDGQQLADPLLVNDTLSLTHLYTQKGTYTVILSTGTNYADTCTVIVQDYVRPSETANIYIFVTGIELVQFHNKIGWWPEYSDSTWLSYETGFTLHIPLNPALQAYERLPWNSSQTCSFTSRVYVNDYTDEYAEDVVSITLSPDGAMIDSMEIRSSYYENMTNYHSVYSRSIRLYDLRLSMPAGTRTHAEYTYYTDNSDWAMKLRGIDESSNIQTDTGKHTSSLQHYRATGPVTISVGFVE